MANSAVITAENVQPVPCVCFAAKDYLFTTEDVYTFDSPRYETKHTHGTGCTFSAVITAELAKGKSIYAAVQKAKNFIALNYSSSNPTSFIYAK